MGKHREWRKIAKKMRRKRVRTALAQERDRTAEQEEEKQRRCPKYQNWLQEQHILEMFTLEEEAREKAELERKWVEEEKAAKIRWEQAQRLKAEAEDKRKQQEALIKAEWEREQAKELKLKEEKELEEGKKREKLAELYQKMDSFISGESVLPDELNASSESNPGKEECPFFKKVGACRFRDSCSRNHLRPGISTTILLPNFYNHFSMGSASMSEYDTDVSLEYGDSEIQKDFVEFYDDIKVELLKYGRIEQLRVCSNSESHLRGNVYVSYKREREAMKAYRGLNGRYYAGKSITVEFINIPSWKAAICGMHFRGRCPKGSRCNFLHVFRNPRGEFWSLDEPKRDNSPEKDREVRNWKWSESESEDEETRAENRRRRKRDRERRRRKRSRSKSRSRKEKSERRRSRHS